MHRKIVCICGEVVLQCRCPGPHDISILTTCVHKKAALPAEKEAHMYDRLTAEQQAQLDNEFSYHKPHGDQQERYGAIRSAAKNLAATILALTPRCADQSAALRKVREAVMTANAAIAINEPEPLDVTIRPAGPVG